MKQKCFLNNDTSKFIILALVIIFSTYIIVDLKTDKITNSVVKSLLEIEYNKVGGMDNYVKVNKIQREQVIQGLKQYEQQNGKIDTNIVKNDSMDKIEKSGNKISMELVDSIINDKNAYILGNPDAEISFIEYSDLECPYCKKLHESGTIEKVLKEYDGKVNFIFKQFPLAFHVKAEMQSQAALCVGELAGKDKYFEFINEVYKGSKTNGRSYTEESISELAGKLGVDKEKVLSCVKSQKYKDEVKRQMKEGSDNFGITGTPGNVFLNKNTGKWDKLPGAYPYENFKQKIDSLLN